MQRRRDEGLHPTKDAQGDRLREYLRLLVPDGQRLTVVSNRGPLTFSHRGGTWRATRGSGGLVTALAELGRIAPVTWVSTAMNPGDRLAARALGDGGSGGGDLEELIRAQLPDQDLRLVLADVSDEAYDLHYATVSNPFLWFIQHRLYQLPYEPKVDDRLIQAWRDGYRVVNEALARSAVAAAGRGRPVVLLQDYHLYLAAGAVRAARPESLLLHFNHIPWPSPDYWEVLPQALRRAICEGLLENDIVGFQTDRYATNFLGTVDAFVRDARVDPAGRNVRWRGRTIWVRAYPISLDPASLVRLARGPAVAAHRAALQVRLARAGGPRLVVRVDRLEPSKNALRGFLAFEALLARRPDLRARVRFLAIQSASRENLAEYADYATAVREVVARVNGMGDPDEAPIWMLDGSDYALAIAALQLADTVLVNPIADGMNLVAKEAVLVADPVLVLSETAGAAEQLASDALMVTAADVAGTARALERALAMSLDERMRRARRLRASVREEDLEWWLGRQLRDLTRVATGQRPPSRQLRDTLRGFEPVMEGSTTG
ncbi:MAG: trehalose-6-phosphate synthase [Chloroflexi bacterium]|nr:trehalose-6-phosphate synthase [Chloroflexota bacterium]